MNLPAMVAAWQAAWQSLDPERVARLYAAEATHMSGIVVSRMNRADATLRGVDEIRAYASVAASQLKSFEACILEVIAEETPDGGRASVEYWRVVNGDEAGRKRVVEIIEWRGEKIVACRVFHF
ncbi:MAG: nuclear transport factor 2 family protein [Parvibaculum sp.]|uniref:nuclear transport factor 2 family protein n=1 Tax=Parvibaculum sp. TaxID=2024848 RepID=UPI002ABC8326|nr:nuclear transport factor 2 family protein [Parvibaculum sp.]MDZ4380079.1 nuclear transport factor 2 family protein [Parvibaculum sp.]